MSARALDPSGPEVATVASHSPLYDRYNGFTLGAFLTTCRFPFTGGRYGVHRRRIDEFLREIDVRIDLPRSHHAFVKRSEPLVQDVLSAIKGHSDTLRDFAGLGAMSVLQGASGGLVTNEQRKILRERWTPVLEKYQISVESYDEWLGGLPKAKRGLSGEDILSPASALLTAALEPLGPEADTCFVAMPFKRPFTEYYSLFYQPALERAGLRAIRAWGGLSSEEYYVLLLTLISRCGFVLAELTTLNLNVINEVGIAHGLPRVVFLIGDRSLSRLPSNIAHLPNMTYSVQGENWMPRAIKRLAEFVTWMKSDVHERGEQASAAILPRRGR